MPIEQLLPHLSRGLSSSGAFDLAAFGGAQHAVDEDVLLVPTGDVFDDAFATRKTSAAAAAAAAAPASGSSNFFGAYGGAADELMMMPTLLREGTGELYLSSPLQQQPVYQVQQQQQQPYQPYQEYQMQLQQHAAASASAMRDVDDDLDEVSMLHQVQVQQQDVGEDVEEEDFDMSTALVPVSARRMRRQVSYLGHSQGFELFHPFETHPQQFHPQQHHQHQLQPLALMPPARDDIMNPPVAAGPNAHLDETRSPLSALPALPDGNYAMQMPPQMDLELRQQEKQRAASVAQARAQLRAPTLFREPSDVGLRVIPTNRIVQMDSHSITSGSDGESELDDHTSVASLCAHDDSPLVAPTPQPLSRRAQPSGMELNTPADMHVDEEEDDDEDNDATMAGTSNDSFVERLDGERRVRLVRKKATVGTAQPPSARDADIIDVGHYSRKQRREIIKRYRAKRATRKSRVVYRQRKRFADVRPRVGGRFVKLTEENLRKWRELKARDEAAAGAFVQRNLDAQAKRRAQAVATARGL